MIMEACCVALKSVPLLPPSSQSWTLLNQRQVVDVTPLLRLTCFNAKYIKFMTAAGE